MNENDISGSWVDPDDAPALDADYFARAELRQGDKIVRRGRPRAAATKQPVSLRIDGDVIDWFRATGAGWQTRINDALRKAAGI